MRNEGERMAPRVGAKSFALHGLGSPPRIFVRRCEFLFKTTKRLS